MPKKNRAVFHFKPFSKKQRMILNWWTEVSPVRDMDGIIADGAIRSGKTVCMSLSFILWAMENFHNENFGMCGKTIGSFRRNVLFWLKLMLKSRGYAVTDHRADNLVVVQRGGVENYFYIFGGKDERSQDLIQGITLAGVFFDEVALMPESFVNQATGRCSVDGSKFWFNCNPAGPFHWFKKDWIDEKQKKRLLYLHFTMDDNLSLSERVKERYRGMYSGVFYKRYILGLWCMAEGVIYDMFDAAKHVISAVSGSATPDRYVSCDYGTQNATVFLLWEKHGADWICCREYYYSGREKGRQRTDTEYADDLQAWLDGIQPKAVIVDPSAASFIAELKKRGYTVRKAKNDVLDGIRVVSTWLNSRHLKIMDCCQNTIEEFSSYVWDEKAADRGEDKPVKASDHCVTGDTLVDVVGGQIRIRDLVGKSGYVYCYDRIRHRKMISKFHNVRKTQNGVKVFRINLEDGRYISATGDHLVLTRRGWVRVKDLTARDQILDISMEGQMYES